MSTCKAIGPTGFLCARRMPCPYHPRVHDLKCWTEYFEHVLSSAKPFEVRRNDRDYRVGDVLHLREWSRRDSAYTGRDCWRRVTYLADEEQMSPFIGAQRLRWVVMGIAPCEPAVCATPNGEKERTT